MAGATALPHLLRLLADGTRLRILALLVREELSVGELSRALGLAQSRVSNHLRQLRESGLLSERHAGKHTHLRVARRGDGTAARLWAAVEDGLTDLPEHAADLARLDRVLAEREHDADFFERVAGNYDKFAVRFETGQARQRTAAHLVARELVVADVGCGTGYMTQPFAGLVRRAICVDRSEAMLERARERLSGSGLDLEFRLGELDALPLADGEVDAVVAGMVLHHLADLDAAFAETFRVVAPGGRAVVLELFPHTQDWMHETLGDRTLGLAPTDVAKAMERAGFTDVFIDAVDDRYAPEGPDGRTASLPLYLVRGTRPAAPAN
ncbi:MAG: metalloregulator ArsR/SmtB family transcription factor [Planctomycetota bacterium]